MISVEDARRAIDACMPAPSPERVPLDAASGRVLAGDVHAVFPLPRFDNSAMDGFAVRAADLRGATGAVPVVLPLAGVVAAGSAGAPPLPPGACLQVMTGAPIPEGADAVVMVERTSGFDRAEVAFLESPRPGQNIRHAGEEVPAGALVIPAGTRIGPPERGILASFGHAAVTVYCRPRVTLLATGDELRDPGEPLAPGEIYNSNLHLLSDLALRAGAELVHAGRVRDDERLVEGAIREALASSDLVALSGGVSMGRYDHVRPALGAIGVRGHFWKVAQRPGGPLFFGTCPSGSGEAGLIFGLPGNPVSAFICFMVYVWPAIAGMTGAPPAAHVAAELSAPLPREAGKHRFLFGRVRSREGRLVAAPSRKLGSHMLSSSLEANAILGSGPGEGELPAGSAVECLLLPWTTITPDV